MGTGTKLWLFLSVALIMAFVFFGLYNGSKIKDLREQIKNQKEFIASMEQDVKIAIKLESIPTWYVVHENKVSSLPNGQGEIVNLSDRSLLSMGNRLGIKRPIPNTKIHFSPSESREQAYTVAGGLLTYEYLDD